MIDNIGGWGAKSKSNPGLVQIIVFGYAMEKAT